MEGSRSSDSRRQQLNIDILLRVNAEESRAVGVSGLQPQTPPLHGSPRLTQPSWSVADWRSRERSSRAAHQNALRSEAGAKPPLLLSSVSLPPICCFASRESLTRRQTWSYRRACSGRRAQGEPFEDSRSPRRHFGYCLVIVGGLAASDGRSESAPFRPDLTAV